MGVSIMASTLFTPAQQQLVAAIARADYLTKTFYFTGGTVLAEYYLHHRISEDLDFFSETDFDPNQLKICLTKTFKNLSPTSVEWQSLNKQEVYFVTLGLERIKLDFAYFPFEHLGDYLKTGNLRISSLTDLMVNKLQAIISRKRGRDFVDLYFGLKQLDMSIPKLIQLYRLKFDVVLSQDEVAKHFLGIKEAVDQPRFLGKLPWDKIESWFVSLAKLEHYQQ